MSPVLTSLCRIMAPASYGVVVCDTGGKILWVNNFFTEMCGYDLQEIEGRKPGSFLHGVATDPADVTRLRQAVQRRESCQTRIRNYHKNGKSYWASIDLHFVSDLPDTADFFLAVEHDITDALAMENKLKDEVLDLYNCILSMADKPLISRI